LPNSEGEVTSANDRESLPSFPIEIICPPTHHFPAPGKPFCGVIDTPDAVIEMCELGFYPIPIELSLVEDR
jgi:hypothetical protein